jgi:hypothetical protein
MKAKYLIIVLAFVLVITCTVTSCKEIPPQATNNLQQKISVSWADGAPDMQGLFTTSNAVVVGKIGKVVDETNELLGESRFGKNYMYYTDFEFIIEANLKAEVKNNSIIIHQIGKAGTQELEDDPLFQSGDSYVLFLREYKPGNYTILGGPQGRFKIVNDKIYSLNYLYSGNNIQLPAATQINGVSETEFLQSLATYSK